MKNIIFTAVVLFFFSCNEETINQPPPESSETLLSIQVDSHFDNDFVNLALNNINLLNSSVTTNYVVNIAWLKNQMLPSGNHTIDFKMPDNGKERLHTFYLQDTLSVIIYFRDSIYFVDYHGLPLRD